ncbi:hypothetical protein D3C78_1355900 [compost metagenome]
MPLLSFNGPTRVTLCPAAVRARYIASMPGARQPSSLVSRMFRALACIDRPTLAMAMMPVRSLFMAKSSVGAADFTKHNAPTE